MSEQLRVGPHALLQRALRPCRVWSLGRLLARLSRLGLLFARVPEVDKIAHLPVRPRREIGSDVRRRVRSAESWASSRPTREHRYERSDRGSQSVPRSAPERRRSLSSAARPGRLPHHPRHRRHRSSARFGGQHRRRPIAKEPARRRDRLDPIRLRYRDRAQSLAVRAHHLNDRVERIAKIRRGRERRRPRRM